MDKKKLAIVLIVLFLVQNVTFAQELLPRTLPLNPHARVSLNKGRLSFSQKYDAVWDVLCMALLIYKLDALKKYSKDVVKESIMNEYDRAFFNLAGIKFDLDNIDIGKKGWTRYYPFHIGDKSYVIRIFRSEEQAYQPKLTVLLEGTVGIKGRYNGTDKKIPVTFQILPGVNAILKKSKIEPQKLSPAPSAEASS